MQTNTIKLQPNTEHIPQKSKVSTPWLNQDTQTTSSELQGILDQVTQWWEAGANFASNKEFAELIAIQEKTKWKHETVVWMQTTDNSKIVAVEELKSAKKSNGSVSYRANELNSTQAKFHNHPTEGENNNKISLQWFSNQDIQTNTQTKEQITKIQWVETANNYTHFLGKAYTIDGQTYETIIASGLDNKDNTQWKKFTIGDKTYNHAVKCPDGQIRDVMELPMHVAHHILHNRLMAVDNNEDSIKIAA